MTGQSFNYDLVFRAHSGQAKSEVEKMRAAVANVTAETKKSAAQSGQGSAALTAQGTAAKQTAADLDRLAAAERRAREEMLKRQGAGGAGGGGRGGSGSGTPEQFGPFLPQGYEETRAQLLPLVAAQQSYQKELARIEAAKKSAIITTREYNAALARARGAYDRQVEVIGRTDAALAGNRRNIRLNRHEYNNLMFQANDTFQSLALGMPIQQVLLQQGPQITQIYGGVGNTFRALRSVLTPLRLALGGIAAVTLTGAVSWNAYLRSTKEVETAASGLGLAVAGGAQEMEAAARAGAAAAGISVSSARSMQAQFLRTGRIGADNYADLIALSKDFARTIGVETAEVGGALADMFADPAKAADELLNKYGLIDAATARNAQRLARQNQLNEAQAVLIAALPNNLASATEATTGLGRAWEAVGRAASNAGDSIGGAIDRITGGGTVETRLQEAQQALANITALGPRQGADSERRAEALEAQIIALETQIVLDEQRRADAERRRTGAVALGLAEQSPAVRSALSRDRLEDEIAALRTGQDAPGLDEEQQRRIAVAIEAKSNALAGLNARQANANELDRIAIRLQVEQNPLIRAELEARKQALELADDEISTQRLDETVQRARTNSINGAIAAAEAQAATLRAEIEVRGRLAVQVASGALTTEQANVLIERELRLRNLVAAAAQAEGEEKVRLEAVLRQLTLGYEALEQLRTRAVGADYIRTQRESLEQLRLEAQLLGVTARERERLLALHEAELEIRRLGIARGGAQAAQIRSNAETIARETAELERFSDAWSKVESTASSAIDTMVDELADGDIDGALEALADDISGMFLELAIKNPLKNAFLGTDLGTLSDVGGLRGIWGRLTGANDNAPISGLGGIGAVEAMNVTAASVVVNGQGGASSIGGFGGGGVAPRGGLQGPDSVQAQAWSFFEGKGLKPHQIAGILGNISAESAFNPLAVGDNGHAFGLFQHNDRAPNLFRHIGGKGNLGDVQAQLEFAWKELMTTEAAAFSKLAASTNVTEATEAFVGFERPQGWTPQNPQGALHFDRRLGAAQDALGKFSSQTTTATENLGTMGQGFDVFGNALGGLLNGQSLGQAGGNLLTNLVGKGLVNLASTINLPGFNAGGYTGHDAPDEVVGLVHGQEFVFGAAATARIGVRNLEKLQSGAMKGFRHGGFVSSLPAPSTFSNGSDQQSSAPVKFTINDYAGVPVEVEEQADRDGGRTVTMTIGQQGAAAINEPGNPMGRALEARYRLRPKVRAR